MIAQGEEEDFNNLKALNKVWIGSDRIIGFGGEEADLGPQEMDMEKTVTCKRGGRGRHSGVAVDDKDSVIEGQRNALDTSDVSQPMNGSFMESNDFSLSKIINDLTKQLGFDKNRDSTSFLFHIDENGRRVSTPLMDSGNVSSAHFQTMLSQGIHEREIEILRRMSTATGSIASNRCSQTTPNNFIRGSKGSRRDSVSNSEEFLGFVPTTENDANTDSWNEFDKVMEKSMPAKEWELHEFEELAEQKNQSVLPEAEDLDQFVSAEEAKIRMDEDEEDRAQFLQSTFLSGKNISMGSFVLDPLQITNYFQARSSFPVDNCANDSTMFGEDRDDVPVRDKTITNFDSNGDDRILQSLINQRTVLVPELSTPPSARAITEFFKSSKSDGLSTTDLVEYILKSCRDHEDQYKETFAKNQGPPVSRISSSQSKINGPTTVSSTLTSTSTNNKNQTPTTLSSQIQANSISTSTSANTKNQGPITLKPPSSQSQQSKRPTTISSSTSNATTMIVTSTSNKNQGPLTLNTSQPKRLVAQVGVASNSAANNRNQGPLNSRLLSFQNQTKKPSNVSWALTSKSNKNQVPPQIINTSSQSQPKRPGGTVSSISISTSTREINNPSSEKKMQGTQVNPPSFQSQIKRPATVVPPTLSSGSYHQQFFQPSAVPAPPPGYQFPISVHIHLPQFQFPFPNPCQHPNPNLQLNDPSNPPSSCTYQYQQQ